MAKHLIVLRFLSVRRFSPQSAQRASRVIKSFSNSSLQGPWGDYYGAVATGLFAAGG